MSGAFVAFFLVTIGLLIHPGAVFSNGSFLLTMIALVVFGKLVICTGIARRNPNESLARQAVERGAYDYLFKTQLDRTPYRGPSGVHRAQRGGGALFAEKERATVTLNSIGDAVISTDIAGCVDYLNAALRDLKYALSQPLAAKSAARPPDAVASSSPASSSAK